MWKLKPKHSWSHTCPPLVTSLKTSDHHHQYHCRRCCCNFHIELQNLGQSLVPSGPSNLVIDLQYDGWKAITPALDLWGRNWPLDMSEVNLPLPFAFWEENDKTTHFFVHVSLLILCWVVIPEQFGQAAPTNLGSFTDKKNVWWEWLHK